jgi:hypothetical protein
VRGWFADRQGQANQVMCRIASQVSQVMRKAGSRVSQVMRGPTEAS